MKLVIQDSEQLAIALLYATEGTRPQLIPLRWPNFMLPIGNRTPPVPSFIDIGPEALEHLQRVQAAKKVQKRRKVS